MKNKEEIKIVPTTYGVVYHGQTHSFIVREEPKKGKIQVQVINIKTGKSKDNLYFSSYAAACSISKELAEKWI